MVDADGGAVILAIDASTEWASLALLDPLTGAAWETGWTAGRDQTTALLPEIDHLLTLSGRSIRRVSGIVVATGPGMFNALRVGMSVAKGLVLGTGAPLIGCPTTLAAAAPAAGFGRTIVAAVPAGRDRLVWSRLSPDRLSIERWPEVDAVNGSIEDLLAALGGDEGEVVLTGEFSPDQEARLRTATSSNVLLLAGGLNRRRAATMAALAAPAFLRGAVDDPASLEPVYAHARAFPIASA